MHVKPVDGQNLETGELYDRMPLITNTQRSNDSNGFILPSISELRAHLRDAVCLNRTTSFTATISTTNAVYSRRPRFERLAAGCGVDDLAITGGHRRRQPFFVPHRLAANNKRNVPGMMVRQNPLMAL